MGRIKSFFQLVKYEFKRVCRNKIVLFMLIFFSIIILLLMSFVSFDTKNYNYAIFTDGMSVKELADTDIVLDEVLGDKAIYVDTIEEGKELVNLSKVPCFIAIDNSGEPVQLTIYYDGSSIFGKTVKENLNNEANKYSYNAIVEFLSEYGITINESYFNAVTFENSNATNVTVRQMPYVLEIGICISIILMFGLAYSNSRDNETNVSKNLGYLPINLNSFLFSKIFVYLIFGLIQLVVCYLAGIFFFEIDYQMNILLLILLSLMFILSTIMFGLLLSSCKSQIATIFLDMIALLLPLFATSLIDIQNFPPILQFVLNCLPLTQFIKFANCAIFSGLILWDSLIIFTIQIIVYYLLTYFILRKRTHN